MPTFFSRLLENCRRTNRSAPRRPHSHPAYSVTYSTREATLKISQAAINAATAPDAPTVTDGQPIEPSAPPAEETPLANCALLVPTSEYERYLQQIDRFTAAIADLEKQRDAARNAERDALRRGLFPEARRFEAEEQRVMALARTRRDDIERVRYRASQTVEAHRARRHADVPQTPKAG